MIVESSNINEDAHFIYISSLVSQKKYQDAYEAVRTAMIYIETPGDDILRLYGLICMKISPPMITDAIETFDNLVKQRGEDMNAVSQNLFTFFPVMSLFNHYCIRSYCREPHVICVSMTGSERLKIFPLYYIINQNC
jgi:hypothetical protein